MKLINDIGSQFMKHLLGLGKITLCNPAAFGFLL